MVFVNCLSKLLCIVNISSYKKEQLKLHGSHFGVKGGGGIKRAFCTALSPTFSCNAKKSLFVGQILVKSMTNSTNTLRKCT